MWNEPWFSNFMARLTLSLPTTALFFQCENQKQKCMKAQQVVCLSNNMKEGFIWCYSEVNEISVYLLYSLLEIEHCHIIVRGYIELWAVIMSPVQ